MNRLVMSSLLLSLGLAGFQTDGLAQAKMTMHCTAVGNNAPDVLDAKQGHTLAASSIACRVEGGPLDMGWATGHQVYEYVGSKGVNKAGLGVIRHPKGSAVWVIDTARTDLQMQEGKVVGWNSTGKGTYTMATGVAKEMEGKTYDFVARPVGPGQLTIESTLDDRK